MGGQDEGKVIGRWEDGVGVKEDIGSVLGSAAAHITTLCAPPVVS